MKKHSNKIIKLVSKTYDINRRKLIAQQYCDRFNHSSNGYYLVFRSGILYYSRQRHGGSDSIKIDISDHFDLQKIRDKKISEILGED